jgi:hypothetical protein
MKVRTSLKIFAAVFATLTLCGCGRTYHITGRIIVMPEMKSTSGFIVEFTGNEIPQGGGPLLGANVRMFHDLDSNDNPNRESVWTQDTSTDANGFFDISDYAAPTSEARVGLEVNKVGYKTVYSTYIDYSNVEPQTFLVLLVPVDR